MVKILAALVAALLILNSSGASPGATEKVAAPVARATCSGASHSSACDLLSQPHLVTAHVRRAVKQRSVKYAKLTVADSKIY